MHTKDLNFSNLSIHPSNPPTSTPNEMPPKTQGLSASPKKVLGKPKIKTCADESLDDSPERSSDEDTRAAANIKPSVFGKRSKSPTPDVKSTKAGTRGSKPKKVTVNENPTRGALIEKARDSPMSSSGSSAGKRKSQGSLEDRFKSSSADPFGRIPHKKPKTIYGSGSQSRKSSSQLAPRPKKNAGSPQASRQGFQVPELLTSPENSQNTQELPAKPTFFKPDEIENSPKKQNMPNPNQFISYTKEDDTLTSTPRAKKDFEKPNSLASPYVSDSKAGDSFTDPGKLEDSPGSTPPSMGRNFQRSANPTLFKRDPNRKPLELKNYDLGNLGGDLAARVKGIIGLDGAELGTDAAGLFDDDFDLSVAAEARCPMCNQPCDAAELKKSGAMNTRQQERFCRSHSKTTAERKWSSKGYPEIDWEKIDSRISDHHKFIKNLLNGADCHFRRTFEEFVRAGKGRALRKMESNLTPGYYGSRGLNIISEHVIREFSTLLSKRSVKDRLISKRGTTAFVQSVIVPEVAVQLIMEDMSIDDAEARDVLTESSNIGELVHEEVRDVVIEKLENSDDDDDQD